MKSLLTRLLRGQEERVFFSIFSLWEAAAAETLIRRGDAKHIPAEQIPENEAVNEHGRRALFALNLPKRLIPEFKQLCEAMRL